MSPTRHNAVRAADGAAVHLRPWSPRWSSRPPQSLGRPPTPGSQQRGPNRANDNLLTRGLSPRDIRSLWVRPANFLRNFYSARSTSAGFSMLGAGERRQGNMMRDAICIKFRAGQIRKQLLVQRFSGHFMCVAPGFDSRWVLSFMFLS